MWAFLAAAWAGPIDLNAATQEDLDRLMGLGASKAAALVEHRRRHGRFERLTDLLSVSNIGRGTLEALRGQVVFGPTVVDEIVPTPPASEARHPRTPSVSAININTADVASLAALPGITGQRAEAIFAWREEFGRFPDCASLSLVPGISLATSRAVGDSCLVEDATL